MARVGARSMEQDVAALNGGHSGRVGLAWIHRAQTPQPKPNRHLTYIIWYAMIKP